MYALCEYTFCHASFIHLLYTVGDYVVTEFRLTNHLDEAGVYPHSLRF